MRLRELRLWLCELSAVARVPGGPREHIEVATIGELQQIAARMGVPLHLKRGRHGRMSSSPCVT